MKNENIYNFSNEEIVNTIADKIVFNFTTNLLISDKTTTKTLKEKLFYSEEELKKIENGKIKVEKQEHKKIHCFQILSAADKIQILNSVIAKTKNKQDNSYPKLKNNFIRLMQELKHEYVSAEKDISQDKSSIYYSLHNDEELFKPNALIKEQIYSTHQQEINPNEVSCGKEIKKFIKNVVNFFQR